MWLFKLHRPVDLRMLQQRGDQRQEPEVDVLGAHHFADRVHGELRRANVHSGDPAECREDGADCAAWIGQNREKEKERDKRQQDREKEQKQIQVKLS